MKKFLSAVTAAVVLCSAMAFGGCNNHGGEQVCFFNPVNKSYADFIASGSTAAQGRGYAMGTDVILTLNDKDGFTEESTYNSFVTLCGEVESLLKEVDASISVSLESSCISKFNAAAAGESVIINKTAYEILSLAKTVYGQTDGYFNPAVYQSLRLYGFGAGFAVKPETMPDQATVRVYKTLSDSFAELTLTEKNGEYFAKKPLTTVTVDGVTHSLMLDLGGIGKGWFADKVNQMIDSAGFEYGYFSFGGSTMAVKRYKSETDDNFYMGIGDPRGSIGEYYARVPAKGVCLSTSGDYMSYYKDGGVRYCHIIDPTTGSPIQTGVASVTVIGGSAAEDDALTTALSAMGKQKAVEYINKNLTARTVIMLVEEGENMLVISNRPESVTLLNTAYSWGNTVKDGKIVLNGSVENPT